MKQKAFFITFKGLSIKKIAQIFLEGKSPTLNDLYKQYLETALLSKKNGTSKIIS